MTKEPKVDIEISIENASVEEILEKHRTADRGHEIVLPERAPERLEKQRAANDRGHEMVLPERARSR